MSSVTWMVGLLGISMVGQAYSQAMRWIYHLDRQAWFAVLCVVLVVGAMCLRGFGSRTNY